MTAHAMLALYALGGLSATAALAARPRPVAGLGGATALAAMLLFWPFLAPAVFLAEAPIAKTDPAAERGGVEDLATRLSQALAAAPPRLGAVATRERSVLDAFVARLRAVEERHHALARAREQAAPALRQRLDALRAGAAQELATGVALLEDVVAQLTLLRFCDGPRAGDSDKDGVESLLVRIEALADLSTPRTSAEGALQGDADAGADPERPHTAGA